jgi:hypothetical protein
MSLKKAYLYLVSIISLVIIVIGGIMLINLALKAWVFKQADQYSSYPCAAVPVAPDGKSAGNCDAQALEVQKKVDEQNRTSQRQRDAAQAIAFIIVATPAWWYHWRAARKEA